MGEQVVEKKPAIKFSKSDWRVIVVCGLVFFLNTAPQGFMFNVMTEIVREVDITRAVFGVVVAVSTLSGAFISAFTGKIMACITSRKTMLAGSLLILPFSLLLGSATGIPMLFAAGVLLGGVVALGTVGVAASVLSENLGARMGVVFGVLSGIAFLSQALVGVIMGSVIPVFGYRAAVIVLGCIVSFISSTLTFFLPRQREVTQNKTTQETMNETSAQLPGLTLAQARKTSSFWLFGIATFLSAMLFSGFVLYITDFFMQNGFDYASATGMYTLLTIASALATACSGFFVRKAGVNTFLAVMLLCFPIGIFLLAFGVPGGGVMVVAVMGVLLCSFVRPINIAPGLVVRELFGPKDYASINTFMLFFFMAGGGLVSFLTGFLVDVFQGDYTFVFVLLAVVSVVSLALFLLSVARSPMKNVTLYH